MHVLDRLLFAEVHPERDLECGRVFPGGAGNDDYDLNISFH